LPCAGRQLRLKLGAHAWAKLNRRKRSRQHRINGVIYVCEVCDLREAGISRGVHSPFGRAKRHTRETSKRKLKSARGGDTPHVTAITPLRANRK
jgi:hypothetical protein